VRYRVAPHRDWFRQFSRLAEYTYHNRILSDGTNSGSSTQHAYYVNTSYWLTGEGDFIGDGFQAYSTIEPLRPFSPSRGLFGSGASQIASQWSHIDHKPDPAGSHLVPRGFGCAGDLPVAPVAAAADTRGTGVGAPDRDFPEAPRYPGPDRTVRAGLLAADRNRQSGAALPNGLSEGQGSLGLSHGRLSEMTRQAAP
jgi:hypothetical protein